MSEYPLEIFDRVLFLSLFFGGASRTDSFQKRSFTVGGEVVLDFGLKVIDHVEVFILHFIDDQILQPGDVLVVRLNQPDEPNNFLFLLHPALKC